MPELLLCTPGPKERYEAELDDMRKRLRSEKNLRRACEKWLRSELKSRVGS